MKIHAYRGIILKSIKYNTYRGGFHIMANIQQGKVECPYCHSKDTKKISGMSKVGSVALWGVFAAGKVSKQWHCNSCKSDF